MSCQARAHCCRICYILKLRHCSDVNLPLAVRGFTPPHGSLAPPRLGTTALRHCFSLKQSNLIKLYDGGIAIHLWKFSFDHLKPSSSPPVNEVYAIFCCQYIEIGSAVYISTCLASGTVSKSNYCDSEKRLSVWSTVFERYIQIPLVMPCLCIYCTLRSTPSWLAEHTKAWAQSASKHIHFRSAPMLIKENIH